MVIEIIILISNGTYDILKMVVLVDPLHLYITHTFSVWMSDYLMYHAYIFFNMFIQEYSYMYPARAEGPALLLVPDIWSSIYI